MSQSIAFGNVGAVKFNGATVSEVRLNGSLIYTAATTLTTQNAYAALRGDKMMGDNDQRGYFRWDQSLNMDNYAIGSNHGSVSPTTFKGQRIDNISTRHWAASANNAGQGYFTFIIAGNHPENFISSITLDGTTFTVGTGYYFSGAEMSTGTNTPITQWKWDCSMGSILTGGSSTVTIS